MKTIAIIPARGGSKRLPHKNLKLLGGIPLVAHSILYAQAFPEIIDAVYVSTDSEEIKQIALQYNAKVIDRPEHLSGDQAPTVSALKHVLQQLEDDDIETVVLLQPTNPLRPPQLLQETFNAYQTNKKTSLFTVSRDYKKLGKINSQKFQPFNYKIGQRSQDLEPLYYENGLLYITQAALIKQDVIFDEASYPFIVNHPYAQVDIDTLDDFEYAEFLLGK